MATLPSPSMRDYSRSGSSQLVQALRRLRQRLKHPRWRGQKRQQLKHPRWLGQKRQQLKHPRRQLQRLKHPRWRGQKRQQLKHPRWRGQELQLPQWRMLCPSRPSFRQQLQGQKHPLCHLPWQLPAHLPHRRRPARLPARLPRPRGQLQRLPQASFWRLLLRHHLFQSSRERCPKMFPPRAGRVITIAKRHALSASGSAINASEGHSGTTRGGGDRGSWR